MVERKVEKFKAHAFGPNHYIWAKGTRSAIRTKFHLVTTIRGVNYFGMFVV